MDLAHRAIHHVPQVVIATSAAPDELDRLRTLLDIEDAVAEFTAAEDVEAAKPEPDLVQVALDRAGVTADRAVFVGDTVWDVQAAGKAGVACVGVLTGGISAAELTERERSRCIPTAGRCCAGWIPAR